MRITHVKHAQKPQQCGRCGDKIKPSRDKKTKVKKRVNGRMRTVTKIERILGDSYIWIKPKSGGKRVRCTKPECRFRTSDMVGGKMSGVYGAQESAEDTVGEWKGGNVDDLKSACEEMAESIKDIAQEYTDSADNMEQAFPNGSPTIEECREKAEGLESWADELEGVDFDEWDGPEAEEEDPEAEAKKTPRDREAGNTDDEPKNSDGETYEEWEDTQREKANEVIGNCPF